MGRGVLRFFFEYGAGGCLWAGDAKTQARLDVGPVDAIIYEVEGRVSRESKIVISEDARRLRDWLDAAHSLYLNPYYQLDPSLWTQEACDNFNAGVDSLLALLQRELNSPTRSWTSKCATPRTRAWAKILLPIQKFLRSKISEDPWFAMAYHVTVSGMEAKSLVK